MVGDVHLSFDERDVELLDREGYDAILFVGDIAGYSHRGGVVVARTIARLTTRAIVMPGNHDAAHVGQMAAEVLAADAMLALFNFGQASRERDFEEALGGVTVAGYSRHPISDTFDVVAARPHSAGGPRLAFLPHLRQRFGVYDRHDSARRIAALLDESDARDVVLLAHNGPTGLGASRDCIWGCDFRKAEGDWGDADLERALERAGGRVRAVVAGHMHHALRGGGKRTWQIERAGVLYVNAARVPRIFERDGRTMRHHVELVVDGGRATAREVRLW